MVWYELEILDHCKRSNFSIEVNQLELAKNEIETSREQMYQKQSSQWWSARKLSAFEIATWQRHRGFERSAWFICSWDSHHCKNNSNELACLTQRSPNPRLLCQKFYIILWLSHRSYVKFAHSSSQCSRLRFRKGDIYSRFKRRVYVRFCCAQMKQNDVFRAPRDGDRSTRSLVSNFFTPTGLSFIICQKNHIVNCRYYSAR